MGIVAYDDLIIHRGVPSAISDTPGNWILPVANMAERRPAKFARTDQLYVEEIVTLPTTHSYSGAFVFCMFGLDYTDGPLAVQFTLGTSIASPSNLYISPLMPWAKEDGVPNRLVHYCTVASPPRALFLIINNQSLAADTDVGRLWFSPYREIGFMRGWQTDDDDSPDIYTSEGGQDYARGRAVRQSVNTEFKAFNYETRQWLRAMKRIAGKSVEVVSSPYGPNATDDKQRAETVYGLAESGQFVHAGGLRYTMTFSQKESR